VVLEARQEGFVTSRGSARRSSFGGNGAKVAAILLALVATGCGRPGSGGTEPTPTHIPQPTPDATMVEVIRGNASPVAYLPPLQIAGSPTPVPAAARPAPATNANRPAPKPTAPPREAAPAREPPPAPKPARESAPVPKPAPTAVKPSTTNPVNGAGAPPAAPAIINPNTALPSGPVRPNTAPGR